MNKLANSLIIGKKIFFLLKVLRINVGMTFNNKNNLKDNNNHCYKQFLWRNI